MKSNKEILIEKFLNIKDLGWTPSRRCNNTGIGKTFEDLANIEENNYDGPDFAEFEIKSHRQEANSPITLFTLAPTFPTKANTYLRDKYGEPYPENPQLNKLHTSMFGDRKNNYVNKYAFRLINDRAKECVRIAIYDYATGDLIDDSAGYTYNKLRSKLYKKLTNLFYVSAERRFVNGVEEFKFTDATIYTNPSFEKFLQILEDGGVQYDIRIGSYQSGKMFGKTHDHGSGFRVREDYLLAIYETVEYVV